MPEAEQQASLPPPNEQSSKARRKGGCARKLLLVFLIGLPVLAILINGPIFRWAAEYGIKMGAESIGLKGDVTVDGTLLSGLELRDVEFKGDGSGPVDTLSLANAKIDYSLFELIRTGGLTWLNQVKLADADVVVVIREKPAIPDEPDVDSDLDKEPDDDDPSILWQLLETHYDIENINLTVTQGTKRYKVDNLTLKLPRGGKGSISIDRLEIPGARPREAIASEVTVTPTSLALGPLRLLDSVEITTLTLNQAAEGAPLLTAVLGLSGGSLDASYTVDGPIKATLTSGSVSLPELMRLAQIDDLKSGSVTKLDLLFTGDLAAPETWQADLALDLETIKWRDQAQLVGAKVDIRASGDYTAPETWKTQMGIELAEGSWMDTGEIGGANLDLQFAGDYRDPSTWISDLQFEIERARWDTARVDDATLIAILDPGDDQAEQVRLDVNRVGAEINATAEVGLGNISNPSEIPDLPFEVDARFTIAAVENILSDYLPSDGPGIPAAGSLSGNLSAKIEELKLLSTQGRINSDNLSYEGIALESLSLTTQTTGLQKLVVDGDIVLDNETSARIDGTLDTGTLDYSANSNITASASGKLEELLGKLGIAKDLEGATIVEWSGSGNLKEKDHQGVAKIDATGFRYGEADRIDASIEGSYNNLDIDLPRLVIESEKLQFEGALKYAENVLELPKLSLKSGELDLLSGYAKTPLDFAVFSAPAAYFSQEGEIEIDIESSELELASLMGLLQQEPPTDCTLGIVLKATGSPSAMNLDGRIIANEINLRRGANIGHARAEIDLLVKEGSATISGRLEQPQIEPFTLNGSMAFAPAEWIKGARDPLAEPFELKAKMKESQLAFLADFIPGIEKISGAVDIDLAAAGTLAKPSVTGTGDLNVESLRFASSSAPSVREVNAALRFEGNVVHIDNLFAVVAGGESRVKGNITFESGKYPVLDLRLGGHEVLIYRNHSLNIRTNLNLNLKGPIDKAELSGIVGITNSLFYKDIDLLPIGGGVGLGGEKSSVPDVSPGPRMPSPKSLDVGVPIKPFSDWTVDVRLVSQTPFRVSGNLARASALCDISVGGTLGKPVPNGRVWVKEGLLKLPFSNIDISEGQVTFNENTGFNGRLSMRAKSEVNDYRISVFVRNQILNPEVLFTSVPPLPREEILTLLASGSTRADLTGDGTTAATKAALLWLKNLTNKQGKIDPDAPPTFAETLEERTDISVGEVDPSSGEMGVSASLRLWKQSYIDFSIGKEGSQRGVLKYIFRFR